MQREKTVLIIEDSELNLELVKAILVREDFSVLEAKEAEEGIALARRARPDLILMDLHLPGIPGLDAVRSIRTDPQLGNTPVIAVTACAMKKDREEALRAGCVDYLIKPFGIEDFVATVKKHIR